MPNILPKVQYIQTPELILFKVIGATGQPSTCRFTVVKLPGLEKLCEDPSELRQKEGPVSKALIALSSTVTSLAQNPYPDRLINYR